ncbi:MAG: cyclic nucleotide-binding domain-containing protein [Fimbriimonadaceae bacterium]|nr:cyclic nucleotide-binding domain-containing protein [Fimbriimonadaceae bacterium]QYK54784.1 MAG: cyclic nucleotide-binding domain-containing protein [Fimbriimonadaceae bacterium]
MDLFDTFRTHYITDGLTDEEVKGLCELGEFIERGDLEDIVREDEVSFDLYVLVEGSGEVRTPAGDVITRLKPGAIIGEFALLEDGQRSATVMSNGASRLLHLDGKKLMDLMETQPRIGMAIYRNLGKTLAQRLRSANVQIERLVSVFGA